MDDASATLTLWRGSYTVDEVTTAGACASDYVITRTFTHTTDDMVRYKRYADDHDY